ncbi:MAG: cation diffusion facilitator family transporter [Alphaproteobacteria bacterium]|nr:cation diffusion facilitator family transporter [Alphaproteobacteria bacterium]
MNADHTHDHAHHHGGAHIHSGVNERRIGWAALLTGVFMLVEVAGGLIAGSLALLADAGHMLTDFAALGLAWAAFRVARRPADWKRTYGFNRFSVLVAFVNGCSLFVIAGFIIVEAVQRLNAPVDVLGGPMLIVASAGLIVNIAAFVILHGADRNNLNVRGAALHVLGDLLGSVAAIVAALIILTTGWTAADPILSVLVALLILRSAWMVVKDSSHILLEGAPAELDSRAIAEDLTSHIPEVVDIHHIHAWSITQERPMMTLHARVSDEARPEVVSAAIKARLAEHFRVEHATVEIEHDDCADEENGAVTKP